MALGSMAASQLQVVAGLVAGVDDALLEDTAAGGVSGVLDALDQLALAWDSELSPAVIRLFGPQPAGLAPESAKPLSESQIAAALADLSDDEVAVLDRMAWGPPYGSLERANRRIDPDAPATPVEQLLHKGLLRPVDRATVILPREIALALRGGRVFEPDGSRPAVPEFPPPSGDHALPEEVRDALARWLLGEVSAADWRAELERAASADLWVRLAHARDDGTLSIDVVRVLYLGQGSAHLVRRAGPRLSVPLSRIISAVAGDPVVIHDLPSG